MENRPIIERYFVLNSDVWVETSNGDRHFHEAFVSPAIADLIATRLNRQNLISEVSHV